ncbi:cytochrome P450 [Annulohypoxylon maeteangense]|uniref:cytochrome P450 n=1 Tax=Annulohypoxylon maeteangense TaxID=1927788 RepID=UPI002007EBFA|nr:cytochrome P450 [Annulohypoxylon maeteangense]KAI0882332.1 cytochrome P450 [Annulohypoxylon maeteangense]
MDVAKYHSDYYISAILVCVVFSWLTSILWSLKPASFSKKAKTNDVYPGGPTPWPIVGNLVYVSKLFKNPDVELMKIAKKFGGISMLWFSSMPVLIISKAEDAKQLLDKRGSIYSDRPSQNEFRERMWPWRLVTTGVGQQFRLLRRIYNNLLGPQQSAGFQKYQDYEAIIMLKDLVEAPADFLAHTERFAISVIFSAVYGVRLVQLDHPIMCEFYSVWEDILNYFQPGTLLLDYFPILQRLPERFQPWMKLAMSLRKRESALNTAFLRTLKMQVQANSAPDCFGTELVKIQETEGVDDEMAINILAMLIGAGADTTSSVLQSFFKVMALNPEAQKAAQEELDRVVGPSRLPTWTDEPNLPYVRALIKEVHRWAPIGSLGVPHATSEEDRYLGRRVPKGTIVFPNLPALSRDPAVYQNPDAFWPERFINDDLNASASANHPDFRRRDHFHYGFGRRLCQGIFVAEASLYIVIARVLWAFDISPRPGEPLDLNAKIAGLVTKPKPYQVRIVPRSDTVRRLVSESVSNTKTDILDFDSITLVPASE